MPMSIKISKNVFKNNYVVLSFKMKFNIIMENINFSIL